MNSPREMVSENSMKGIDSPSSVNSNELINVSDIVFNPELDQKPVSKNNNKNKNWLWGIIIISIVIILAVLFLLLDYFNIIPLGIFNNKSTFSNTCISAII